jgi:hypothetical protein
MGLEAATYIDQLVGTNPDGADDKNQGDNHLRLIKNVLQSQFPNLGTTALTPTAVQLNDIIDNNRGMPAGTIVMWSGTDNNVPTGWAYCDGTNGTPNLVSKFIRAGASQGSGGSDTSSGSIGGTALTLDQIPPHTHGAFGQISETGGSVSGSTQKLDFGQTSSSGLGATHNHTFIGGDNKPAYYELVYIMKVG